MAAHGTVTVYVYTSDAQIPLEGAAVTITRRLPDGAQELLGLRLTNFDGYTEPVDVQTPPAEQSQSFHAGDAPFASVDLRVQLLHYGSVLVQNAQVFAGQQTLQEMMLVPTPTLPESYTRLQVFDVSAQEL